MLDLFLIIWIILLVFGLITFIYGFPAMIKVGPIPTSKKGTEKAVALADIKPGENFYELGCGEGRVLVKTVEKYDCFGVGYELVIPYYLLAKLRARLSKKSKNINVRCQNFFKADLRDADVIFCFLTPGLMQKLGKYFQEQELKKGVRIVSYAFKIRNLEPERIIKHSKENWNIYMYRL
ncbi:MAG: class I SAM-dependent methyltransferase [Candidatus Pacebacteria bacterium]|nr:class I SAM-dependent methyltransferase [Candidatus Paceibacterota bacterium]